MEEKRCTNRWHSDDLAHWPCPPAPCPDCGKEPWCSREYCESKRGSVFGTDEDEPAAEEHYLGCRLYPGDCTEALHFKHTCERPKGHLGKHRVFDEGEWAWEPGDTDAVAALRAENERLREAAQKADELIDNMRASGCTGCLGPTCEVNRGLDEWFAARARATPDGGGGE